MAFRAVAAGTAVFAVLTRAVRVNDDLEADKDVQASSLKWWGKKTTNTEPAPAPPTPLADHGFCCCKNEPCTINSISDTKEIDSVYSPNQNMCCKLKKRTCGHWMQSFSGYRNKPPTEDYCNVATPQDKPFEPAPILVTEAPSPAPVYEPGTVGHTVHEYCNFSKHVEFSGDEDKEAETRHKIVRQLVEQLEDNSIDAMAKSMFSVYMCVRWAPTGEFQDMAQGEMSAEQIDQKTVVQHYEDFTFLPLKCSPNMHVYDAQKELNQTYFEQFEAEMNSLSDWFLNEQSSVMATRLRDISEARRRGRQQEVEDFSRAFDLPVVGRVADACVDENNGKVLVNVFTATTDELFADCAGVKWWLTKLSDWHRSFSFSTFMTPTNIANDAKPDKDQQVMLCFGKRVASQLHRRKAGAHLMTDQSTVGCHGFYDFKVASEMVGRIIKLWRPPTCQLAAMELDFKVKILEMMDSMNDALFDALPSLIMEEETGQDNFDGTKMMPAGALGSLAGMWKAIAARFNFFQTTYTRLGNLLGETTVKWVVCPLNTITEQEDLDTLDQSLGSEDHVARYYSKIANAEHTGDTDLPGDSCEDAVPGVPRAKGCSLGKMRESMPEPYRAEEFLCPVLPLLPAHAQLAVFQRKEGECMLHMSLEQLVAKHWYYRGHTPSQKQYNVTVNEPTKDYQAMRIISFRSAVDDKFNIYRNFVKFGVGCTEAENEITPRWCGPPTIFNDGLSDRNLLTNLPLPVQGEGISNNAASSRFQSWLYRTVKGAERAIRRSRTEWLGRASDRYNKLYAKSFVETEENELLHSLTYQKHLGDTGGDQTGRETYDRYAVTVPCVGFEPERLFSLKNTWAEYGYQLARKAKKHYNTGNKISDSPAFQMEVRGEALLHVQNEENAYLSYYTHMRAFELGGWETEWRKTDNPILTQLSGALDPVLSANLRANHVRGFTATFTCGTKRQMHDAVIEGLTVNDPNLPASFTDCVKNGVTTNAQLKEENPTAIFLEQQVVVRMTIKELQKCYKHTDPSLIGNANETENHVFKNFLEAIAECETLSDVPDEAKNIGTAQSTYRGLLLGKGTPPDTLQEVLLDPADFLAETGF